MTFRIWISSRMVGSDSSDTMTPRRGTNTTRPSRSRRASASRTGVRLTPRDWHRAFSSK